LIELGTGFTEVAQAEAALVCFLFAHFEQCLQKIINNNKSTYIDGSLVHCLFEFMHRDVYNRQQNNECRKRENIRTRFCKHIVEENAASQSKSNSYQSLGHLESLLFVLEQFDL
jgi:hypothetical protein